MNIKQEVLPTDRIENVASNNSSIVACVFVVAVTYLPNRCLAMVWDTHTG
jgi:hypothetical protein